MMGRMVMQVGEERGRGRRGRPRLGRSRIQRKTNSSCSGRMERRARGSALYISPVSMVTGTWLVCTWRITGTPTSGTLRVLHHVIGAMVMGTWRSPGCWTNMQRKVA